MQPQLLRRAAHRPLSHRRVRLEVGQKARPRPGQGSAVLDQRAVEGGDLPPVRARGFEQLIARPERVLVRPQRRPVAGIDLGSDKVQKSPPQFRSAAHQVDVRVSKPDHPRHFEIIPLFRLYHRVERHLSPLGGVIKLHVPPRDMPIDHKPLSPVPDRIRQPAGPGRLQPGQHAHRLEKRGLPLRVRADEDIHPRRKLALERLKASEVA